MTTYACKQSSDDIYKNEADYAALEGVPLMASATTTPGSTATAASRSIASTTFPGLRRTALQACPPADHVLQKTAGNALRAMPASEATTMVGVTVPDTAKPGDALHVALPTTTSNHLPVVIACVVPDGVASGGTFFVRVPETDCAAAMNNTTNDLNLQMHASSVNVVAPTIPAKLV